MREQRVLLHWVRCWNHVGRMAHHRSSLLLVVLRPKILVVRMGQKSLLVLRIPQSHRGHHHAVVLALLEQGYCPGERRGPVVSSSKVQLEGISQGRDSSCWKVPLVELWQSCCRHCGTKTTMVQ